MYLRQKEVLVIDIYYIFKNTVPVKQKCTVGAEHLVTRSEKEHTHEKNIKKLNRQIVSVSNVKHPMTFVKNLLKLFTQP